MNDKKIRKKLKKIIKSSHSCIRKEVAQEALYHTDIRNFFTDLLQYGCISGMVGKLVYYSDTHSFFQEYYAEIEELRSLYEDMLGEPLSPKGDLMNWYAWFAFEETARQLAEELGII